MAIVASAAMMVYVTTGTEGVMMLVVTLLAGLLLIRIGAARSKAQLGTQRATMEPRAYAGREQ